MRRSAHGRGGFAADRADVDGRAARAVRFLFAGAVLLACAVVAAPAGATSAGLQPTSLELGVLASLNEVRTEHGLNPLRLSSELSAAARQHSSEMARLGYFSHSSADGSLFWRRIGRYYPVGHFQRWSVGENLVWNSPGLDAAGAVDAWMQSPEHRENVLTPSWREIGISAVRAAAAPGVFGGRGITIITTDFGLRTSS